MTGGEFFGGGSFERYVERMPTAFAVTRGTAHTLVYVNAAFRRLMDAAGEPTIGSPVTEAFGGRDMRGLVEVLDRAMRTGVVVRDRRIEPAQERGPAWCCTVWPEMSDWGEPTHLIIELRAATEAELTLALQRDLAEGMLLSALREHDVADVAEASRRRAQFLANEGRRLTESLDEDTTLQAMARVALPQLGAWCIVDIVDEDGTMRRLALIHPDPERQAILRELEGRWSPEPGDPFGAPVALRSPQPTLIADDIDAALAVAAHDPETLRILLALDVGPLLTVPLLVHERLVGAITFVGGSRDHAFTPDDVALAEGLGVRSAMALDNARLHGEAVALKMRAESASQAKSTFLGTMSHELRTPLNAIGGYVDLIDMGLRGPVTEAQHADLARIRRNQRHLLALITDILNFVQVGSGRTEYDIRDVVLHELLTEGVALVEALILQKQLVFDRISCDATIVARADPEKVTQILLNVLSNAIKFTPPGGRVGIACEATDDALLVRVADTGIGIPPDKLAAIFEPFVQVRRGLTGPDRGVGLGLSISRDLARGMGGDLTVESEDGAGSTFTLRLPIAAVEQTWLGVPH
ncbi:MAG: ATP-binding protein [Gemmatimonadota bacterium]|nr:ATP-binding protein [Gemmatimonadota bacterium]